MSLYNYNTARNIKKTPKEIAQETFPNKDVKGAISYGFKVVGYCGINKELPLFDKLGQYSSFKDVIDSISEKVILIDVTSKEIFTESYKHLMDNDLKNSVDETLAYFESYGGYLDEEMNHVIDLKSHVVGPHFGVNLLLGDRSSLSNPLLTTPKSVVDPYGCGSFRGPAANQVLATRWDMLPEENGNPFNRQFYILEDGKQIFYTHNIRDNVKTAKCIHKVNHSIITYETLCGLEIKRTIYIKRQHNESEPIALERHVVEITNKTNKPRNLEIVFTGMFGSANPGCQMVDVIYQTVINQTMVITNEDDVKIAIAPDYYPEYAKEYLRFFTLDREGFDSFSYNVSSFIGNGSIEYPENVSFLNNELRLKGPSFFAVSRKVNLKANQSEKIVSSVGLIANTHSQDDYEKALTSVFDVDDRKELDELKNEYDKFSKAFQLKTNDKELNTYVNHVLPFQVLYQTYVSRAFAQTQKGYREIGFREIQDLYASMDYLIKDGKQEVVKSLLSNWTCNVYEMGYANHNFFFVGKEPGMCSDDQLWLVDAIYRYIKITNDYKFLNEEFLIAGSDKKRTLLDTLKAIVVYSSKISVGKHNIPLLDKADWNDCLKIDDDCLDGPAKEKQYFEQLKKNNQPYGVKFESDLSESVMNGFLLVIALDDMIEISKQIKLNDYVVELEFTKDTLVKSLRNNAFVNGFYARVLINKEGKYKYVGIPGDKLSLLDDFDGSLYLNSFSWSILSGVATEDEIKKMLPLVDRYLKTKAGYKLCTSHNLKLCGSKEAATEQYFLGDRENGGVFKHATMMFVVSLLKASKAVKDKLLKETLMDDARYMLDIVLPYNVMKNPYKYKGNPRFCTQYVNSISEEHIGPILSGTATWLLLAIRELYE